MRLKLFFTKVIKIMLLMLVIIIISDIHIYSQIVNIEGKRIVTDKAGWAGFVDVGINLQKTQKKLFNLTGLGHAQFKTFKNLFLLLTSFEFLTVNNGDLENKMLVHFRYNRKMNKSLGWEGFVQHQFNKVKNIKSRFLFGTGPRFKIKGMNKLKSYLGILYMYEIEKLTDTMILGKYHRISSYLSFSFSPSDKITFVSTTYYQPNIEKFSDYRVSSGNSFLVKLSRRLSLILNVGVEYDSMPAEGIDKLSYAVNNSLRYTF